MVPRLVHARKAKLMLAMVNKTDKLDARGLNRLQRSGTLPTVWIPSRELRDQRELPRTRMVFSRTRTRLKNRIHATLAKYALSVEEVSDLFGKKGRELLQQVLEQLPPHTRFATEQLLAQLDRVEQQIQLFERRIREVFAPAPELTWVMSLPWVGFILGIVSLLEIGEVERFASAEHLASYAGSTPRVIAPGGKMHYGQVRQDVNRYLKWTFMQAANVICLHHRSFPQRHVHRLYERCPAESGGPTCTSIIAIRLKMPLRGQLGFSVGYFAKCFLEFSLAGLACPCPKIILGFKRRELFCYRKSDHLIDRYIVPLRNFFNPLVKRIAATNGCFAYIIAAFPL